MCNCEVISHYNVVTLSQCTSFLFECEELQCQCPGLLCHYSSYAGRSHTAGLVWVEVIDSFLCFFVQRFARALAEAVTSLNLPVEVINMGDYDPEDGLSEEVGMA